MMLMPRFLIVTASISVLAACSNVEHSIFGGDRVNVAGANQILPESFELIELESLLDPEGKRTAFKSKDDDLSKAFQAFYANYPTAEQGNRRDRVQDRLIAASNQRCNVYKTYLKRLDSHAGFLFGALSTALGGAGAIVTGETAARTLSGLAGITSGVGAEYEKNFFANVATHFIIPGIDQRRDEILAEIATKRGDANGTATPITKYTVERAVADVSLYHGACSLNVGLSRSGKLVDEALRPGSTALKTMLDDIIAAQEKMKKITSGAPFKVDPGAIQKETLPPPKN